MRIFIPVLLGITMLLGISCQKDKNDSQDRKFVSLKLDNKIYLSENPKGTVYVPDFTDTDPLNDFPKMEVIGQSYTGDVISLTLVAPALPFTPGIYPCSREGNTLQVILNNPYPVTLSSKGSSNCFINITRIDNVTVEGKFIGTLSDAGGSGLSRELKDGAFRAVIKTVSQ
ncbi:MAG TPA: hypothetical protein VM802_18825 [Chitinophaga sp.]|uniref:hypothetical protein n=1 Tax=Chitinophaga sp. TaxID=1869181 RepID=UPI002BF9773F|nr:hypothetical protein [Chitinophaga sp.]HVI46941.1 hypothetical protein [Chitinophaga sp.]